MRNGVMPYMTCSECGFSELEEGCQEYGEKGEILCSYCYEEIYGMKFERIDPITYFWVGAGIMTLFVTLVLIFGFRN